MGNRVWQFPINFVVCLTTLVRYPVTSDSKFTVLACCPDLYHGLSWTLHSGIYNRKLDIFIILVSYIDQFKLSWCLRHPTSLPGHHCCEHFDSIFIPMSVLAWCSAFHWLQCLGSHDFLRWPNYAVSIFSLFQPREYVWSDLNTLYTQHIVATYGYSQTYHVW